MKKEKAMHRRVVPGAMRVVLLVAAILSAGGDALAFRNGPMVPANPGRLLSRLPAGHRAVMVRGTEYFYHGGAFYRHGPGGYRPVIAPIGALLVGLPVGFATAVVAGITYYTFAGVYYRKVPEGYVVVENPVETVVVKAVVPAEMPSSPVGVTVAVTVETLNVRVAPGVDFSIVGQVDKGNRLIIRGHAPDWYFVELPSGEFGWVMMKFTDPVSALAPAAG